MSQYGEVVVHTQVLIPSRISLKIIKSKDSETENFMVTNVWLFRMETRVQAPQTHSLSGNDRPCAGEH